MLPEILGMSFSPWTKSEDPHAQIISWEPERIEQNRMSLENKRKKLDIELDLIRLQNKKNAAEKKLEVMALLQSAAEPKDSSEEREKREMKELMETFGWFTPLQNKIKWSL